MCNYKRVYSTSSSLPFLLSGVYAFVVLKKKVDVPEAQLCKQLKDKVSKSIAKYACPDYIQVTVSKLL